MPYVADAVIAEEDTEKLVKVVAAETIARAPDRVGPGQGARTDIRCELSRVTRKLSESMTSDYLAARIKRDHPDIADAVMRGEYRSIRQAAD